MTVEEFRKQLETPYAWPGGYAIIGITSDGGMICIDCMVKEKENIEDSIKTETNDGWRIITFDNSSNLDSLEGELTLCEHCSEPIE